ncbi:MAG: hypothetical protein H6641_07085 [Caldilineaceae bacterium]|nr:hypothetical protein [Caldilineaceae bacterium]
MELIVQATFAGGVLVPQDTLSLSDNTRVQIRITVSDNELLAQSTLFGAFPQLAALAETKADDIKQIWNDSIEQQLEIMQTEDC